MMMDELTLPPRVYLSYAGRSPSAELWPAAAALLAPALALSGTHDADDIRAAVVSGDMQLWLADGLAVATEIAVYPRLKTCVLCFVGGRAVAGDGGLTAAADTLLTAIDVFARAHGCTRLEGGGRVGWGRLMRAAGWRTKHEFWKELTP